MKAEKLLKDLEEKNLFNYKPTQGDEQNYVDRIIVGSVLLPWLGYKHDNFEYNVVKENLKPDYIVKLSGNILFFIEDKSTAENDPVKTYKSQIVEYLKKISRRGILTNGFKLWILELYGDEFKILYNIDFKKAVNSLFAEEEKSKIERFYREFSKERFSDLDKRIDELACSEEEFLKKVQDIQGRERMFIEEVKTVIKELKMDVYGKLKNSLEKVRERDEIFTIETHSVKSLLENLTNIEPELNGKKKEIFEELERLITQLIKKLGYISPEEIEKIEKWRKNAKLNNLEKKEYDKLVTKLKKVNSELQRFQVLYSQEIAIAEAYRLWQDGWKEFLSHTPKTTHNEKNTCDSLFQEEYSLQVAYAFFIKVFILRILEDKGLIKRLLSDGGFSLWKKLTENLSLVNTRGHLRIDLLFSLVHRHIKEKIFSDIEKNPVYDWYIPDDLLFLRVLEILNKYRFADIHQDLIGYIYEKLMEEVHRHDLGVYLTPPEVVEYILDRAGYAGKTIIGRKVIDPACGSGTFLVHAVRRYRKALEETKTPDLSEKFIRDIQENFYGIDINSFSVYLAGVNLFIQILDDIKTILDNRKTIEPVSFHLEVANTFRIWKELKKTGFYYVFSNPPYVSAKTANFSPPEDLIEVFRNRLHGDINTYVLFLCIAQEIVTDRGRIAYIVPFTLLGDQQTNNLREYFERNGKILHVTKFHKRTGILFEGVTQAVVVFVWTKSNSEEKTTIAWGGVEKEDRTGMIDEAVKNTINIGNIFYRFTKPKKNEPQMSMYEKNSSNYSIWVVLSGKNTDHVKKLYETFNIIYRNTKTLQELLKNHYIASDRDFKEGDVNTGYVKDYHTEKSNPHAITVYKGEDLRPFGTLPENPAGIKGKDGKDRPPYVAPKENEQRTGINKRLWELFEKKETEYLVVFNRIINTFNHPRNIRGLVVCRSEKDKKAFTDKVWLIKTPSEDVAKKLASLLFSVPFNFQYNAINTNTQVDKNVLLVLKVPENIPDEIVSYYDCLEKISREFKQFGIEDITDYLNPLWYNLKEGLKFEDIIPWNTLIQGLSLISLENFLLRYGKKVKDPKGGKIESYLRGDYWNFENEYAEKVIKIFVSKYKNEKYEVINRELLLPDDPILLMKKFLSLEKRFNDLLSNWKNALYSIDNILCEVFGINIPPEELVMPFIV